MLELYLSGSWHGRSIRRKLEQQQNTHFQCGNLCWGGGYAHIVAMAILDDFA